LQSWNLLQRGEGSDHPNDYRTGHVRSSETGRAATMAHDHGRHTTLAFECYPFQDPESQGW